MKVQTGDPIGFRDTNNHIERHIEGNITILRPVTTAEPKLAPNQFYMRLKPSPILSIDGIPDKCAGRIVISRNFGTFHIPALGKTMLVEVLDPKLCMVM